MTGSSLAGNMKVFRAHFDVQLIRVADRRQNVPSNSGSAVASVRNDVKLPNPSSFLNPSMDAMEFPQSLDARQNSHP